MKKLIKLTLATTAMIFSIGAAQALPIMTGGISFAGGYTPNDNNLTVATTITFGPTAVFGTAGSFASVPLFSPVAMFSPLAINPPVVPASALWSVGGFTFNLSTLSEFPPPTANTLTLVGDGIVHNALFNDTPGTWIATFNSAGGTFSWSSSTGVVPDGGLTVG